MDTNKRILRCFLAGKYPRLECPQCENTFLTNVYGMSCPDQPMSLLPENDACLRVFDAYDDVAGGKKDYVILEKYALGLELFCDAIQKYPLRHRPFIQRLGVIDEDDQIRDPSCIQLFSGDEPDYRLIYVMERLEHLNKEDVDFFTEHVHDIDWMEEADRHQLWKWVAERYSPSLAEDIRQLCRYYREHEEHVGWDLHGDNLMRTRQGEIVVMDPFIAK